MLDGGGLIQKALANTSRYGILSKMYYFRRSGLFMGVADITERILLSKLVGLALISPMLKPRYL